MPSNYFAAAGTLNAPDVTGICARANSQVFISGMRARTVVEFRQPALLSAYALLLPLLSVKDKGQDE